MGKAGFTNINRWVSLIIGRQVSDNTSYRRFTRILQGLISALADMGLGNSLTNSLPETCLLRNLCHS